MKRENLESKEFGLIIASRNFPFYAAPEADAVMDGLEERIKELEADNERLKAEREEANSWDDSWKMAEQITQLEKCLVNARKENAKLECLVLHAMFKWAAAMACFFSYKIDDCDKKEVKRNISKMNRYDKKADKYCKAYRKAKADLNRTK